MGHISQAGAAFWAGGGGDSCDGYAWWARGRSSAVNGRGSVLVAETRGEWPNGVGRRDDRMSVPVLPSPRDRAPRSRSRHVHLTQCRIAAVSQRAVAIGTRVTPQGRLSRLRRPSDGRREPAHRIALLVFGALVAAACAYARAARMPSPWTLVGLDDESPAGDGG